MRPADKPLRRSPSKYPWQRIADDGAMGGELASGVDYDCSNNSLIRIAKYWARNHDMTVTVRTTDTGVWFRFNSPS